MKKLFVLTFLLFSLISSAQQKLVVFDYLTVFKGDEPIETKSGQARFYFNYNGDSDVIKIYLIGNSVSETSIIILNKIDETLYDKNVEGIEYEAYPVIVVDSGEEFVFQYFPTANVVRFIPYDSQITLEFYSK